MNDAKVKELLSQPGQAVIKVYEHPTAGWLVWVCGTDFGFDDEASCWRFVAGVAMSRVVVL